MMDEYTKKVVIEGDEFSTMRHDANLVIQKLLRNMVEKDTLEGDLAIKIHIRLVREFQSLPREVWDEQGQSRQILKPHFDHKISSTMQVKDSADGESYSDLYELVYDKNTDSYVLAPVKEGQQMTIFDLQGGDGKDEEEANEQPEEKPVYGLPDFSASESPDTASEPAGEVIDVDCVVIEADGHSEAEDAPEDACEDTDDGGRIDEDTLAESMNPPEDDAEAFDYEYEEPEEFLEEGEM